MSILITGAAGFIGGYLYKKLKELNYSVIGIDNFYNPSYSHCDIYSQIIHDDIRTFKWNDKFDTIIHLAAQISVDHSNTEIKETFDININGTINILENIKHDKFIFASTSETYGTNINPGKEMPVDHPQIPKSPYGVSKMAIDNLLRVKNEICNSNNIIIRHFNVFGFGQSKKAFISKAISDAIKYNKIFIYGDGNQLRDYTHVNDCVNYYVKSLNFDKGIYSHGKGFIISVKEIADIIQYIFKDSYNKHIDIEYIDPRPGEVQELRHSTLSSSERHFQIAKMQVEIKKIIEEFK